MRAGSAAILEVENPVQGRDISESRHFPVDAQPGFRIGPQRCDFAYIFIQLRRPLLLHPTLQERVARLVAIGKGEREQRPEIGNGSQFHFIES